MRYLLSLLLIFCCSFSIAQTTQAPAVALNFLTVSPDGRGSGVGMAGVATDADNFSSFYNAAKLSRLQDEYGLSVGYAPYLQKVAKGMGLASLSGFRKLDEESMIGLDVRFFSMGKIDFKDDVGYDLYSYTPSEWAIGLTYSRKISVYLNIGATFRYINSRMATGMVYEGQEINSANVAGSDIGIYYSSITAEEQSEYTGNSFSLGATIQNLGSRVRYQSSTDALPQPLTAKAGAAYTAASESGHRFTLTGELSKLLVSGQDGIGWGGGVEYSYNNALFLRTGIYNNSSYGAKQLMTLGAGYRTGTFSMDFSYLSQMGSGAASGMNENFKLSLGFNISNE